MYPKNPKLENITVDEGTQIIGPTNAHYKDTTKELNSL